MRMWIVLVVVFAVLAAMIGALKYRVDDNYDVSTSGKIGFRVKRRFGNLLIEVYAVIVAIIVDVTLVYEDGVGLVTVASVHLGQNDDPIWVLIFVLPLLLFLIWCVYTGIVVYIAKMGIYFGFMKSRKTARMKIRSLRRFLKTGEDPDGETERMVMRHCARE